MSRIFIHLTRKAQQAMLLKRPWMAGSEIARELQINELIRCQDGIGWFVTTMGDKVFLSLSKHIQWDGSIAHFVGVESAQEVQSKLQNLPRRPKPGLSSPHIKSLLLDDAIERQPDG